MRPRRKASEESTVMREAREDDVTIEFVPVGRSRREWMWKARDDSNTITISGHRFGSLRDAVRDARLQIRGTESDVPS